MLAERYDELTSRIIQAPGAAGRKSLAGVDHLLLVLPEKPTAAVWKALPRGSQLQALVKRAAPGAVPALTTHLNNERHTAVSVGLLPRKADPFEQLEFARKLVAATTAGKSVSLGLRIEGFDERQAAQLAERFAAAVHAVAFSLADFKTRKRPFRIRALRILGLGAKLDLARVQAEAAGTNLARWLTAMPPNKLHAKAYVELLRDLAGREGWHFTRYGVRELEQMGAGAFLAVAQGNPDDSAAIVRLRYRPARSRAPALCLVGKGIIFDTGGTNLKPFAAMSDMHIDMGGSAVAAGSLLALSRIKAPLAVDCWLAITENRIGPTAYKSQDVVTAVNGKTIQVVHTDAEGRMALADTLVLACRERPRLVMDYATLTGACINAVTRRYSGAFTNRPDWHPVLKRAGYASGERVWPFPFGKEFLHELESETADLKQCTPDAGGDHILAATFLNEFVTEDIPWVHIDLSAMKHKGGLAHVPTDITGFGVRFTTALLLDQQVMRETVGIDAGARS